VSCVLQATSAKLIGDAIQKNPAFLTLRKIEVRCMQGLALVLTSTDVGGYGQQCCCSAVLQAARDIAGTIASSQNRVFLNADSLLLNLAEMDMVNTKG